MSVVLHFVDQNFDPHPIVRASRGYGSRSVRHTLMQRGLCLLQLRRAVKSNGQDV